MEDKRKYIYKKEKGRCSINTEEGAPNEEERLRGKEKVIEQKGSSMLM